MCTDVFVLLWPWYCSSCLHLDPVTLFFLCIVMNVWMCLFWRDHDIVACVCTLTSFLYFCCVLWEDTDVSAPVWPWYMSLVRFWCVACNNQLFDTHLRSGCDCYLKLKYSALVCRVIWSYLDSLPICLKSDSLLQLNFIKLVYWLELCSVNLCLLFHNWRCYYY